MTRDRLTARYGAVVSRLLESSPLRNRAFRLFYFGSVGAAVGYTMQATIAAWLMATLTPSELMVALVQTASTSPTLLFGLVAGALADIIDRRRLILVTQIGLFAATLLLGIVTLAGVVGPASLLFLTFVVGAGFTFYLPAQQASINELVPRAELPRAVALGAVAFNVARAVGPAFAGALAAWLSSGSALVASALFFLVMILAIRRHRMRDVALPGVPERLLSGVMSGVRFARHSPAMRSFILRNLSFAVCASSLWALLPVIARDVLGLGAGGYGLLSAGFGAGAVGGALWLPGHLQRRTLNVITLSGVAVWTVALLLIAVTRYTWLAMVGVFGCGIAWVFVFASLSAGTQSTAPAWVRARALSMNLVAVQASLAVGSAVWGAVASAAGVRVSLAVSAGALVLLHLVHRRIVVEMGKEADVMPRARLPELTISGERPMPDDGPVLIQIEYRIEPSERNAFVRAIRRVGPTRRRNGATSWRVYRDLGEEDRYVERYVIESWAEYVRLRSRMTMADSRLQERVEGLQRPGVPIRVSRLIGVDLASVEGEAESFSRVG
jgi:MFS family permease